MNLARRFNGGEHAKATGVAKRPNESSRVTTKCEVSNPARPEPQPIEERCKYGPSAQPREATQNRSDKTQNLIDFRRGRRVEYASSIYIHTVARERQRPPPRQMRTENEEPNLNFRTRMGGTIEQEQLLGEALRAACDTRFLAVDPGARHRTASVFETLFGSEQAVIVADENTFEAAGRDVQDSLSALAQECVEPIIFGSDVHAEYLFVDELYAALKRGNAIPIAVGSGTLNDITKLAAHRLRRPYLTMATAASMDGYTAFGASLTYRGSKQTFDCPAPAAVLADLDVIACAPPGMNASGYADLMAKCAAGADWILADAAGAEPIDEPIWNAIQGPLRSWICSPEGVARNNPASLRHLVYGLMMSGFAMQALRSSRPASGAEHQFSHLWDMQQHTHNGAAPSHGFKVGIGTLASLALYEDLLSRDAGSFSIEAAMENWPSSEALEDRIAACLGAGELGRKAREEMRAKYAGREELRNQLSRLRDLWPSLQVRLRRHLLGFGEARARLREAGCPFEPEQTGISRQRLRLSYEQAYFIRRRFTVLDFAERWDLTRSALDNLFGAGGPWPFGESDPAGETATMTTKDSAGSRR